MKMWELEVHAKNITDLAAEEILQQIAIMHTECYLVKVDIALVYINKVC